MMGGRLRLALAAPLVLLATVTGCDSSRLASYGLATHFASILIAAHFAQIVVDFFDKVRSKERVYRNALVIGLPGTVIGVLSLPMQGPIELYDVVFAALFTAWFVSSSVVSVAIVAAWFLVQVAPDRPVVTYSVLITAVMSGALGSVALVTNADWPVVIIVCSGGLWLVPLVFLPVIQQIGARARRAQNAARLEKTE